MQELTIKRFYQNVSDNLWYDALNNKMVDMKQSGIIDPASVEKSAIMSAVSISGNLFNNRMCNYQ